MRLTVGILQRVGGLVIVFLGVTFIIFFLVFALPGDPIAALGGDRPLSPSVVEALREKYGLNDPLWQQYLHWLGGLFTGDFGIDLKGRPVADQLAARWPVTVTLALTAWVLEVVFGLGLGLIAALRAGKMTDRTILGLTILASSIPVFVLGSSAQLLFGVRLGWFPVAGTHAGWPVAYLLPAIIIAVLGLAATSRLMRASAIEQLNADSVRLVRAKGVGEGRVVGVHVMRNSLIPAATFLATDLGFLLGGTIIIEGIFNLPGVGNLLFSAVRAHEGPTVVAISTLLIIIFLLTAALIDLLQVALDPRLRRE